MVELAQTHTDIQFWSSSIEILFRVYLLPFIGSKWFSEFSQTYLCWRGKRKPSFILSGSRNKEKSIQSLLFHCKKYLYHTSAKNALSMKCQYILKLK